MQVSLGAGAAGRRSCPTRCALARTRTCARSRSASANAARASRSSARVRGIEAIVTGRAGNDPDDHRTLVDRITVELSGLSRR